MQFIFGRELNEGELYDRKNEVNTILNSYKTRQPIGVIGFRRVGKSSILNNVKYLLEKDNVLVLKFSIEGISNLNEYSNRLIYSMLKELSKKYKLKYYKEEIKRLITYQFPIFIPDHLQFHKNNIILHSVSMIIIIEQWNYN